MIKSANSWSVSDQPAEFWLGIEQFNQGDYYACHDTLEAIWLEANPSEQAFYQGILQIAVGLYHLTNLNWQGAAILLGEGSNRLNAYGDIHGGINVNELINQATDWLLALQETGPDQVQQLASVLLDRSPKAVQHSLEEEDNLITPNIQLVYNSNEISP
ncbi:MAG: DUF309 domain-containing protein [Leptolyngbyaceae cyanobacterium MAG.088]|nr:DUF309 domain-containing protein [Leptolyngbyaceae cyanobacterium MAG.088]